MFKFFVLMLLSTTAFAQEVRIYQTDHLGNKQYHKPSIVIQTNGRGVEVNSVGVKQYHKSQIQIETKSETKKGK